MKKIRFSFVSKVSGDLHVLQVTYSTEEIVRHVNIGVERRKQLYVLTHITTKDILDLLLLEATFNDQPTSTIHTSRGTHFGKQESNNVFGLGEYHELGNIQSSLNILDDASSCKCP